MPAPLMAMLGFFGFVAPSYSTPGDAVYGAGGCASETST